MAVVQRGLTLEQFLALPEEKPALEYEDGMVTQKVAPKGRHSALQAALVRYFDNAALARKLARAFPELRVTFGGVSRVPDVSVYRWERVPRDAAGRVADVFTVPPDLVIEIVSPQQSVNELVRRCLWYVDHGVPLALLVDPEDESVIRFQPNEEPRALRGADEFDFADVLPGLQLAVRELFASLQME
ncbi:MAG TPA: Uma2 family endonuclease [Chloroflexota bacterium]|nr:Uma2 family endonuclease [Chloroflexota bacterium]